MAVNGQNQGRGGRAMLRVAGLPFKLMKASDTNSNGTNSRQSICVAARNRDSFDDKRASMLFVQQVNEQSMDTVRSRRLDVVGDIVGDKGTPSSHTSHNLISSGQNSNSNDYKACDETRSRQNCLIKRTQMGQSSSESNTSSSLADDANASSPLFAVDKDKRVSILPEDPHSQSQMRKEHNNNSTNANNNNNINIIDDIDNKGALTIDIVQSNTGGPTELIGGESQFSDSPLCNGKA